VTVARAALAVSRAVLAVPRAWGDRRTWRELAFVLLGALVSLPTFALALLGLAAAALSVVIFGLALLVGVLAIARRTPRYFRHPARRLVGWDWPDPPPLTAPTRWRRAVAILGDPTAWRALTYCFLRFPLIYAGAYGALIAIFTGTLSLTYPAWWLIRPDAFGVESTSWPGAWWRALQGAALLLALPWVVRLIVLLDSLLVRALLWPTPAARRIAQLKAGRAALQEDAAALMRRVERDLHDGTQARLVSLGVALARIQHRSGEDQIRALAADARGTVTEALTELRDIVRGLHPPALDDGLEVALSTLAARSAVPATVTVDLPARPPDATASALYFAVAELLTNIARHAAATRATITVGEEGPWVTLTVTDDGRGGAVPGPTSLPGASSGVPLRGSSPSGALSSGALPSDASASGSAASGASGSGSAASGAWGAGSAAAGGAGGAGTGLSGLARRAAALDGALTVESPPGGPTTVTMKLPREPG